MLHFECGWMSLLICLRERPGEDIIRAFLYTDVVTVSGNIFMVVASLFRMETMEYNLDMVDTEIMMHEMTDFMYQPISSSSVKVEPYLETVHGPYLQIIEEPKQRGFRFRYECEGPSHGGLPGASSEKNKKTYPTVKVGNHLGRAKVEVQLVTHTDPPRIHAHSLVGKHCNDSGTCSVIVGPNDLTAQFNNLGILHVTKRGVVEVLTKRLKEEKMKQRGTRNHFTDTEEQTIVKEAKELSKTMDLNVVRLKFTAYLQDSQGGYTLALKPAISKPIYDSKSPNASNLKISRMDKTCGSVLGGDEIFLLCDKVQKDDIEIRFYEEEDGCWEALGDFSPTDVHKQYAIVFKTPKYHTIEIERPVTVFLQLKRKKGGDCSEPKQFTYVPHIQDKEEVKRKRQKPLPHMYDQWRGPPGGSGGAGSGAGGPGGGVGGGDTLFPFGQLDMGGCFSQFARGSGFGGGGAQMSESSEAQQVQESERRSIGPPRAGSPRQRQLLQIASALQGRATLTARRMARALLDYCSTGDVRLLLAVQRHLCAVRDENGDTPLHLAIIHQQLPVIEQLVHAIVSMHQQKLLDTRNHLGQTPLHLAVITRQPKVVDFLMRAGADPSLFDRDGRSAVHLAATLGDEHTLRAVLACLAEQHAYLVNTADNSGFLPLHLAVRKGGERCLRALVEGGARVDAVELKSGCTALHVAVKENLFKVAFLLITELKADVNAVTFAGNAPLHLAACLGSPTLCSMLIAAGAQKDAENDEPLFISSSSDEEHEEVELSSTKQQATPSQWSEKPCKRHAAGHTPFDLAKCQRVRDLLDYRKSPTPTRPVADTPKTHEEDGPQLDSDTLQQLCGILSEGHVPWRQLAQKLGMLTLADLFQETASPCRSLLESYQVAGGRIEGLVEALESLGLNNGVRLLRQRELKDKTHAADSTVDSGFGSQTMEDMERPVLADS
ncbi:nuclear factor NF-kappa-B p100 subunit-like isoform X2 [Scleropages formosus]|uniref:nuclear factor NF-kappa-B p100 subunit-like isoform X2 n=1 Tax=Scleropages formosus TaxID=113540 RepID=UPI0008790C75|nr:nuclear factor NF-kappa-B p100 subunit-like isoform X2 [Scleropages formosus]